MGFRNTVIKLINIYIAINRDIKYEMLLLFFNLSEYLNVFSDDVDCFAWLAKTVVGTVCVFVRRELASE
ncbi:hypothetical protein A2592_02435 [Candidatus Kaiserbacteria bacterium RIFOXYD1_FULL_42_15]|uniref:Uncharacterized protein n=1 Tax=Candidatus Kaiserbacteria bacterium RIFOXYD1_FULL_42_15 TaxID=1798532 RepID=A0A1F6FPN9_9BACT|nr:MAG: hypothetical protein A2592_02435 [Candidatus Kaiserbacteria bacterium RIFOXYD1_FULL_42_15]